MKNFVMKNDPELNRRAPGTFPCVMRVEDSEGKEHIVEQLFPGYSRGGIAEADVLDKFNSVAETLPRDQRDSIASTALKLDGASSTESFFASLRS